MFALPPGAAAKEALTLLFEMVRNDELTVEQALSCIRFEPPAVTAGDEPLRFRFASDKDALRVVLLMVRDKIHPVEKVVSCMGFE